MTDMGQGRLRVVVDKRKHKHFVYEPPLTMGRDTMTSTLTPRTHDARVYPDDTWTREERMRFWGSYLDAREGTYEFRCKRYDIVIDRLQAMGMRRTDTVLDMGAGRMEFARRLRDRGHLGLYTPIDGSIDGTDLNTWSPVDYVDWVVGIEVIEHVYDPQSLVVGMKVSARFGMVVTTPNPEVVDVLAMDPTHVHPVTRADLAQWGMEQETVSLFTEADDTIVGWYDRKDITRSLTR